MTSTKASEPQATLDFTAPAAVGDSKPSVVQPDKQKLLRRLRRIEGQVRGVAGMVEADRYCVDVLTQLAAARAALHQVSLQILENHARGCVAQAVRDGRGDEAVAELVSVLRRVAGRNSD